MLQASESDGIILQKQQEKVHNKRGRGKDPVVLLSFHETKEAFGIYLSHHTGWMWYSCDILLF